MELDEDLDDGPRQPLIHGEALARPVAGGAEPPQLAGDLAAGMVLPLPDAADEGFPPHAAPVGLFSCASSRSTTIWVAMPAWSVPGCHSTSRPRNRSKRHNMSWIVTLSAWPIWSDPVTFGGGSTMVKGAASGRLPQRKEPALSQS